MYQPGKIRMFKMVNEDLGSPMHLNSPLTYVIGKRYSVDDADTHPAQDCGAGLHVATLQWIFQNWEYGCGRRILICEFTANDIACIPDDPSGKLRLHRMKVVGELSPQELGLDLPKEKADAVKP
jgi:hypothetical protein